MSDLAEFSMYERPIIDEDSIRVSVVLVTPELAEEWLSKNTHNRNLRREEINAYARDMADGNWHFTGETIVFSDDDVLLDGQNRLHAVVKSDTPVTMLVVWGVEMQAQDAMDSGTKRTAGDALSLRGEKSSALLASAATIVFTDGASSRRKPSHAEILKIIEDDPSIRQIVQEVLPVLKLNSILSGTVAFYAYWRISKIDPTEAYAFFSGLSTLVDLPAGSPILALHRRLVRLSDEHKGKSAHIFRREALACIFRSWNSWRRGETLQKIQLSYIAGRVHVPEPR